MMPVLSIVMLLATLAFLYLIIRSINRNRLSLEQAFVWLIIGGVLLVFVLFAEVSTWLAKMMGFSLTSNFLLSLVIFFLLLATFLHTIQISKQNDQIKNLIQELSISNQRISELEEERHEK